MSLRHFTIVSLCALLLIVLAPWARAGFDDPNMSFYAYKRGVGETKMVKALTVRTTVDGPVAHTKLHYVIANQDPERIEVCFNLHLPDATLLTGFGYYYQGRFIRGEMYDRQKAWEIYQAVTGRGRDPGVMDRDSERDYHAQIFPVEPKHDLEVIVELTQIIGSDEQGLFLEVPVKLHAIEGGLKADWQVTWLNANSTRVNAANYTTDSTTQQVGDNAVVRIQKDNVAADKNWVIRRERPATGTLTMTYSGMSGRRGYYVLFISPDHMLQKPKAELLNRIGTDLSMPTRFNMVPRYGRIAIAGTYSKPGSTRVELTDGLGRRLTADVTLAGRRPGPNHAAPLWADKRIAQLQNNYRKDWRPEIIRLSQKYHVMSEYTSLLAIPAEELKRYKEIMAKENVSTNTDQFRGGDPYIHVKAPEDAQRVVAVFPDGTAKELTFSERTDNWSGRFDIPFGTAPGRYSVTIIVVHKDGARSRFILEYENKLSSLLAANATSLRAHPGEAVALTLTGSGINRAVAVTPWGERVTLNGCNGSWQGTVTVPKTWPTGESTITAVLLDGAHNRTEISIDLQVE